MNLNIMDGMKSVEDRIKECVNIRAQFESMGILTIPWIKEKLSRHMNAFVKTGVSETFQLKIPDTQTSFQIILTASDDKQSGVVMKQ